MSDESFNQMTVLASQLIDYDVSGEEYRGEQREEVIDVNVELDESEEESDEDRMVVAGEDQEDGGDKNEEQVEMVMEEDAEEDGTHEKDSSPKKKEDGVVEIFEVDAQWLIILLSEKFQDKMAEEVLDIETNVLSVLALENPRECEKKLFAILGVEKFEIISLLVRNKAPIYWGT